MLCQDCNKNESTFHMTQIVNNQKVELNLCRSCAAKRGFSNPFDKIPFPLAEFLTGMLREKSGQTSQALQSLKCPSCNFTFADFSKTGRLGCGSCYTAFGIQLKDLLRKVHNSSEHRGKTPATTLKKLAPVRVERKLREELRQAIEQENFEAAAKIRDQLKSLMEECNQ
jgi:protein arginine kinase activator